MTNPPTHPATRYETTALKSRLRIHREPFTAELHQAHRGGFSFTRFGRENTFSLSMTGDNGDGSRGTARVVLTDEDLVELHESIGEVIEDNDLR